MKPYHKMGVHWIPVHQRRADEEYMQRLKPSCIKIINPDPEQVKRCLTYIDPNGYVWLRDHPLSEQKNDAMTKPVETGIRHANEWYEKLTNRFKNVFDPNRIIVSGINEPFVRDEKEERAALEYNLALLNRATELGFKVAALNLSVGWPRNLGKDLPPYWDTFLPLEDAINRGNHFLSVHEYWYADPDENWFTYNGKEFGWLAYRVNYCPMQVPIIIGECGMEKMVDLTRWQNDGKPNKGWIGNLTEDQYAEQLWRYARKVNPNVISILPFTTDWGSHDWDTQDTLFAQPAIVNRIEPAKWEEAQPMKNYYWPEGNITQYFGDSRWVKDHTGIDYSMSQGTELRSILDGVVQWVDWDEGGYGWYIRVYHPEYNVDSFFAHLREKPKLQRGQTVKAGELLGYSGNTGNSTGPHLHLEIRMKEDINTDKSSYYGRGRTDPLLFKHILENKKV